LLSFDEGDQLNMALAAQSMSYDPLTHNLRHLEPVTSYSQLPSPLPLTHKYLVRVGYTHARLRGYPVLGRAIPVCRR
jgi:hypothetical protein